MLLATELTVPFPDCTGIWTSNLHFQSQTWLLWPLGHSWPLISLLTLFFTHFLPVPPSNLLFSPVLFVPSSTPFLCIEQGSDNSRTWFSLDLLVPTTWPLWMKPSTKKALRVVWICLPDSPMSRGGDEVQAAVDSAVRHLSSIHSGFWVQVVFKLAVYVVDDWLPAAWHKLN